MLENVDNSCCRACRGKLEVVGTLDALVKVECQNCGDVYYVGDIALPCCDPNCNGEVDLFTVTQFFSLGHQFTACHPCGTCGRLHWPSSKGVTDHRGHRTFLQNDAIVNKDALGHAVCPQ